MERTGFGGSCKCTRTERKEKVWVSVDLLGASVGLPAGNFSIRSFSECVSGAETFIHAVVNDGRRDIEIWCRGRDRAEAWHTGLRRYLLIG